MDDVQGRPSEVTAESEITTPEQLLLSVVTTEAGRNPELVDSLMRGFSQAQEEQQVRQTASPAAGPKIVGVAQEPVEAPAAGKKARAPYRAPTSPLAWRISLIQKEALLSFGIWIFAMLFAFFPVAGNWTAGSAELRALMSGVYCVVFFGSAMGACKFLDRKDFVPELQTYALAAATMVAPLVSLFGAVATRQQELRIAAGVGGAIAVVMILLGVLLTRRILGQPWFTPVFLGIGGLTIGSTAILPKWPVAGATVLLVVCIAWRERALFSAGAGPIGAWRLHRWGTWLVLAVALTAALGSRLLGAG
jgi:hypothetical protein